MAANWYISMITLIALILYSQVFSIKSKVFMMFPVLLAIMTGWLVALIGTVTGMISPDSAAYLKTDLIASASWFSFAPMMPFKWGFLILAVQLSGPELSECWPVIWHQW